MAIIQNAIIQNQNGDLSFGGLVNAIQNIEESTSMSLFQYTRRSIVNSRVYIDNTLANEDILTPTMQNIMNLYVGLIMTAMNMNQYVQGTKKVRDSMSVVATEDFTPVSINSMMRSYFLKGNNSDGVIDTLNPFVDKERTSTSARNSAGYSDAKTNNKDTSAGMDVPLPSGRIIQIEFNNGDNHKTFTVNILLNLQPNFVPAEVIKQFVAINFKPSIYQRWIQASAGEIKFISDFLLGNDLRKQRFDALKKDKTGTLQQMVDRKENSLSNYWLKLAQVSPERQNIANTILIYEKRTFDKACNDSGVNFKSYSSRQKFFNSTMSMMVVVIDTMYNKITMYYHGITDPSVFTFDQMKKNAKTEATDILAMMKNYAQGMAPRF